LQEIDRRLAGGGIDATVPLHKRAGLFQSGREDDGPHDNESRVHPDWWKELRRDEIGHTTVMTPLGIRLDPSQTAPMVAEVFEVRAVDKQYFVCMFACPTCLHAPQNTSQKYQLASDKVVA
jgi:hypothetical protein